MNQTKSIFSNLIYFVLLFLSFFLIGVIVEKFLLDAYIFIAKYIMKLHWIWDIIILFVLVNIGGIIIGSAISSISQLAFIVNTKFPNNKIKKIITIISALFFSIFLIFELWSIPVNGFWTVILTIIFSITILALYLPFIYMTYIETD